MTSVKSKKGSESAPSVVGSLPARIEPNDLTSLNEALDYLFHELSTATEFHRTDINAGREGVIHSVETVTKFLSLFAPVISSSLHRPFGVLHDALMSLDDGKVLPLLKPMKKSGRARASAMRESLIGATVFTVNRLMDTGMHAPVARKTVASTLKALNIKPARGRIAAITARTVREWCERVAADVKRHGEAAQTYDELIAADDTNGLLPKQTRTVLLVRLADVATKIRAHEGA